MSRPATATISLSAILDNYCTAKRLGNGANTVMVIKANAYGHGAREIATFMDHHVDMFGVASIDEAEELRQAGVISPILLMEGCFDEQEWLQAQSLKADVVIHNDEQLQQFLSLLLHRPMSVWLKVDTGMHRLGFSVSQAGSIIAALAHHSNVKELVVMTHLADADSLDSKMTQQQLALFTQLTESLGVATSVANSAGLLFWKSARSDWNRPGLMLYGVPLADSQDMPVVLEPAMVLSSKVIAIRDINVGDAVGYNCRWQANRPSVIATVAIGYGDGYPRNAVDGTPVLVKGQLAPLVGRVSMDMITVDVTEIDNVAVGDPVELWGQQLPVSRVAEYCDSNSYEMLTRVAARVKKHFINENTD